MTKRFGISGQNLSENDLTNLLLAREELTKQEKMQIKAMLTRLQEAKYSSASMSEAELSYLRDELVRFIRERSENIEIHQRA